MKTLEESMAYASRKKREQLGRFESQHEKSIAEMDDFLAGKKSAVAVTAGLEFLSVWHQWKFTAAFLDNGDVDKDALARATLYGIESNNVRHFLGTKVEGYKQAIAFDKAVKHLAQALLLGWDGLAIPYGRLLVTMLYGKHYKGWHPACKHPWLMLEVFCRWQGIRLDRAKLNAPTDMGVYGPVLDGWDTRDASLVSDLIDRMAIFRLAQSDESEYRDRTPDFPSSDYFAYPIEILLWLNIRSRLGLPGPVAGNDLMRLRINTWATQSAEVPAHASLPEVRRKLLRDYPGTGFALESLSVVAYPEA